MTNEEALKHSATREAIQVMTIIDLERELNSARAEIVKLKEWCERWRETTNETTKFLHDVNEKLKGL